MGPENFKTLLASPEPVVTLFLAIVMVRLAHPQEHGVGIVLGLACEVLVFNPHANPFLRTLNTDVSQTQLSTVGTREDLFGAPTREQSGGDKTRKHKKIKANKELEAGKNKWQELVKLVKKDSMFRDGGGGGGGVGHRHDRRASKGSIRARAAVQEEGEISYLILTEATNTGIGISKHATASLFTPFTQYDITTTKRCKGTGLGRSIARPLAEFMEDHIDVLRDDQESGIVKDEPEEE
ncbi:hypothetical protein B0T26DRAFT_753820 [Lasiosphaeria miniovina]|uniref:Histidine kinase/HSP90-like ATPase domain-containing protein n=1 Tax=Lasiosphaeria miniovina TaxID=1954250 RepID=A0AA40ADD5_9PEZI|nr:uncharacterized protein B0T26DRAFT_753820 [Lasiosphaeria miniovina]KAK0713732.1 hypothetical protein B0T26DRAFT_753820 [Lasiosphaeria miniovina]